LSRVRVKICGICREEDVRAAVEAGADYLGFIVGVPSSPRNLPLEAAQRLMRMTPDTVRKVIVTISNAPDQERTLPLLLKTLSPDAVQLHGDILPIPISIRKRFPNIELFGSIPIRDEPSISKALRMSKVFDGIHADSYAIGLRGGTGIAHNWKLSARIRDLIYPKPLILAGGLSAYNIVEAIQVVRPFAVDVSTGVESNPGVKDHQKIAEFVRRARETSF